jgi:hypothetical protein
MLAANRRRLDCANEPSQLGPRPAGRGPRSEMGTGRRTRNPSRDPQATEGDFRSEGVKTRLRQEAVAKLLGRRKCPPVGVKSVGVSSRTA